MDLSQLSDSDLKAYASGDVTKVSDAGLKLMAGQTAPQEKPSIFGKIRGAAESVLEPLATLATGAIAAPVAGFAGMAGDIYSGINGSQRIGDQVATAVQHAMTYQPRSQGGQENLQTLGKVFDDSKLAGLPIAGNELSQIGRAAAQQVPAIKAMTAAAPGAVAASPEAGIFSTAKQALTPKPNTLNAEAFETLKRAIDAGAVVPPSSVNPTFMNRMIESVPGKIATAQEASNLNQVRFAEPLARRAIGLPEGTPLTTDATKAVRAKAYQDGYAPVAQIGSVATDTEFGKSLDAIGSKYTGAANSFPDAVRNDVGSLIESLKVPGFNSSDALQMSQILRDESGKSFAAGDTGLGSAQRAASKAIEDQIERSLAGGGDASGKLLQNFRDARELMAKSHSVEDAIREGTGTLDAKALARQLQGGAHLSGDLETIARFANTFEKANQRPGQVAGPGVHNLRTLGGASAGGVLGALLGGPVGAGIGGAASVMLPPAIREYILSSGAQNRLLQKVAPPSTPQNGLTRALSLAKPGAYEVGGLPPREFSSNPLLSLLEDSPTSTQTHTPINGIDFPLRQEVLQRPEIVKAIEAFRTEAQPLEQAAANAINPTARANAQSRLEALQQEFARGMKMLGIENAADAHGLNRPLYDGSGPMKPGGSGRTQLLIQKTFTP